MSPVSLTFAGQLFWASFAFQFRFLSAYEIWFGIFLPCLHPPPWLSSRPCLSVFYIDRMAQSSYARCFHDWDKLSDASCNTFCRQISCICPISHRVPGSDESFSRSCLAFLIAIRQFPLNANCRDEISNIYSCYFCAILAKYFRCLSRTTLSQSLMMYMV
jgi:hypothetical protein